MAIPLIPAAVAIAAKFFPVIATKLGGKSGAKVAEQVVRTAIKVAGVKRGASPQEVIRAIADDPRKADELRLRLAELDAEAHQSEVEDRVSARASQARRGGWRASLMLIGVVLGLCMTVGAVFFIAPEHVAAMTLLTTVAGALLKMLSDAFAFEFGSSQGSKAKSDTIDQITTQMTELARSRATARDGQEPAAGGVSHSPPDAGSAPPAVEPKLPPSPAPVGGAQPRETRPEPEPPQRDFVAELVSEARG